MAYEATPPAENGTTVYDAARDTKIQTGIVDAAATADAALEAAETAQETAASAVSGLTGRADRNLSNLTSQAAARTNLGLGAAAVMSPLQLATDSAINGRFSNRFRSFMGQLQPRSALQYPTLTTPITITQSATSSVTSPIVYTVSARQDLFPAIGAHLAVVARDPSKATPDSITPYAVGNDLTGVQPYAWEFLSDGGLFNIGVRDGSGKYRILVDRLDGNGWQYAASNAFTQVNSNGGSGINIEVDATAIGGAGTMRLWRIESDGVLFASVFRFNRSATVVARPKRRPFGIMGGDSITEGTGSDARMDSCGQLLGRLLGMDMWSSGSGGTGYVTVPGGSAPNRVKYGDRLQNDVLKWKPDFILHAMGQNDGGVAISTPATLVAACDDIYARTSQECPSAIQIVTGPLRVAAPSAGNTAADDIIRARAQAAGLSFISLCTGKTYAGDGTVIIDGTSPFTGTGTDRRPAPTIGTATPSTGGSLDAGTYYLKITTTDAGGETTPSAEVSATVAATGRITLTWTQAAGSSGYKVYMGTSAGGQDRLVATITGASTVSTVINSYTGGTAATPPASNTSGRKGDGTADFLITFDGIHPTQAGHVAIAHYLAQSIRLIFDYYAG